jgi:DNA-directed RNA polymerase subunit RPC12/RpoP
LTEITFTEKNSSGKILTCPSCTTELELDQSESRTREVSCPECGTKFKLILPSAGNDAATTKEEEINLPPELAEGIFRPIKYSQLPWEEKATLMWSWYWRTFIISLFVVWSAGFVGGIVGVLIAKVMGQLDALPLTTIGYIIGSIIGFFGTHPIIKVLTRSRIGDYQITILKRHISSQKASAA